MTPTEKRPMGRPKKPAGTVYKQTAFRLPPALWERINRLTDERGRAEFIREALEREVTRRERMQKKAALTTSESGVKGKE